MSDTGIKYGGDLGSSSSGASFQPAAPLNDQGADFSADTGSADSGSKLDTAKQAVRDNASKYTAQAGDKARDYAQQGLMRAHDGLGQLSRTIEDAAQQIDEKLGSQYGDYARSAAGQVTALADRLQAKDPDELIEDVRGFVRQSPGAAIGVAATIGFVLARLVGAGVDDRRA